MSAVADTSHHLYPLISDLGLILMTAGIAVLIFKKIKQWLKDKAEKEKNRKPVVNSYLVVSLGFLVLTIIFFIIYTCL